MNGHERFERQKKEYFQLRQPYDYHSAIPGYNIPITEKTELLTTPIDTGIVKANIEETVIDTVGKVGVVTLTENTIKCGTPSEDIFNKFKIGDMISVVISAYPAGDRETAGDGTRPSGENAGDNESTITSSKTSFHKVTTLDTETHTISFSPDITDKNGGNNLINNLGKDDSELGDHLHVYILGRVQQKESRCSRLEKNINVYSFSLRPEDHQPSGTCNFSRIDTARLITGAHLSSSDKIYAVNYNILRIMSGMGGVAYSN